nr:hypothetical protein [Tanacetum cinerariifolium]
MVHKAMIGAIKQRRTANFTRMAFSSNSSSDNKERDDLKLKLEKFQTSSENLTDLLASQTNEKTGLGYNSQVFTTAMFDCGDYYSSESDCKRWPPSSLYDRFQPSGGYHAVSPLYTGTFMPPKPDLVFNTAPTAVETGHLAFNVQLSPPKPEQDLSHTSRPSAPIIKDWVSDSEEESETKDPQQFVPSFAQSSEHVKTHRHSVQPFETTFKVATSVPASPKSNSSGKRRNRKACFVCKSVDHLIKDCNYHTKNMAQPTPRNYANKGHHNQYASLIHSKPQKHRVPTAVLTQSKPVSNTGVRPVSVALPNITVTRLRHAHQVVTKFKSPIQRHITRNPSSRTRNSPPRVNAVQLLMVSAVQGKQETWGNPQQALKDKEVIDSGCSRHMTRNMSYLSDFEELNGGYVSFGGNLKGSKITGKGKIKTGKLDFDDVYFVKELKFNLFSVLQMCDKKNSILFTDTECLVLSSAFKLPDESQVLLRVPRENNMYNVNLKNIVPSEDLTCLFAKATLDESNLWHKRLAHFCGLNGIKREFSVPRTPQQNGIVERKNRTLIEATRTMLADSLLPIPFRAEAVNTACYVQNRVLVTKPHNKTPYELLHGRSPSIGFIRPFGCPVTILNTLDPLGKFQGKVDEGFLVGYTVCSKSFRPFDIDSLTRTMNYHPVTAGNQTNYGAGFQDNFDAEKAGEEVDQSYMLFPMWSTSSTNPQNNADDATFDGKEHDFDAKGKSPVEYVTGYKDLNAEFQDCSKNNSNEVTTASSTVPTVGQNSLNNTNTLSSAGPSNTAVSPIYGKTSDIDASQLLDDQDMPGLEDIIYSDDEDVVGAEADFNNLESSIPVSPIPTTRTHKDHPTSQIIGDLSSTTQTRSMTRVVKDQGGLLQMFVDLPYGKRAIGTKWVYRNKNDERGIVIRNKARLVAQGHTQEDGIDYEEVFASVARIEAIRLFLAYSSFIGFMVYQMDVKSAFLYRTIKEEVYVCQPLGFEDPDYPNKVYKVVKDIYGLHQAPRAWYETLDDIIFGATNKDLCRSFKKLMKDKFQMSSMGELTFFLGLQVKQKKDGIFISQDKYVADILRKFGLTEGKSASTPIDTEKPLPKDPDGEDVDVHTYRLISWQCKKQTVVATSSTEAEYVVSASCCAQVQWIQNQLLDYGLVRTVDNSSKFYMYSRFIQLIIQNQLGVETPLFEGMLVTGELEEQGDAEEQEALKACAFLARRVEHLEYDKVAQALEITKLKRRRIKSSDDTDMEDASNQERMIDALDMDEVKGRQAEIYKIDMDHASKVLSMQEDESEVQEVVDVVTTAKLITEVVTAASESVTAASTTIAAAEPQVPAATITALPIRVVVASTRRRKRVIIRDPEEESTAIIPADTKSKDKEKGIMEEEPKPLKKK